jgi:hypothetical protein
MAETPAPALLPEAAAGDPPARQRLPGFLRDITPGELGGE